MVFTTEGYFEVAIESWAEWDLKSRPLIPFRRSNRLSYQAMSSTCTEGFFEVAAERWPEWDLNPRLQNSVQTTEFSSKEDYYTRWKISI